MLPVLRIHGGGFAAGAGSEPRYTNSALVQKNVVLVTINYRLGVLGFLANEDLVKEGQGHAGNYGLRDMAAALRWVKANIANFGGDLGNVTIFGESAGSFSISALMAAPETRGLFQKAIGESGAFFGDILSTSPVTERARGDQAWTDSVGMKNLTELRAMPADKLIDAASKQPVARFSPVVDGKFLTEPIPATYPAGRQAHVPTIIGWNHDERAGILSKDMTTEKWKAYAAEHYGEQAERFLTAFPGNSDEESVRSANDYTTAGYIWLRRLEVGGDSSQHRPVAGVSLPLRIGPRRRARCTRRGNTRSTQTNSNMPSERSTFDAELPGSQRTAS
jgi:para-nitrobenzyl esterase